MTLFKRGVVWWVKSTRNGKRIQKTTGTRSKAEARKFADGLQLAARAPTFEAAVEFLRLYYGDEAAKEIPLGSAWDRYLETAKSVGRVAGEKSMRLRHERLDRFVRWAEKNRNAITTVEKVDGPCAAAYASDVAKSGLAAKTRQNIIGELVAVWNILAKVSPRLSNPWKGLSPKDNDSKRLDAFTDAQVDALLAAAQTVGHDWWLAVKIGVTTGLRYGDIANLRWTSVDLAAKAIRLNPQKTASHGIEVAIPLVDDALVAELARRKAEADKAEDDTYLALFVIPEHAACYGDLGRGAYNKINFRAVMETAGIRGNFTFHSLRHTFRSRLARAGVSTETAMRLCGHTSAAMSAHYDHTDHLDETRMAIESAMST